MRYARIQISEEEYEAVKEKYEETKSKRLARRLRVILLRYEGKTNSEIGEILGINGQSVSPIIQKFKEQGVEEFCRNKYTSHNRNLTQEQEEEVLTRFRKEAEAGKIVEPHEIKEAFDAACGKVTNPSYFYAVLKRNNWRKVMPRSKHPKAAKEEACDASKKLSNL